MNELMPAELVAKEGQTRELDIRRRVAQAMLTDAPPWPICLDVCRHAWIVAAEWQEEEVEFAEEQERQADRMNMWYRADEMMTAARVYRAAARELRKAAEEGGEP